MNIRIIHWNISYNGDIDNKIIFLKKHIDSNTIICLQEVQKSIYEKLQTELKPDFNTFSLEQRPPGKYEGKNRRLGVCIMTYSYKLLEFKLANRSIFPERTNYIYVSNGNSTFGIFSFHSITGCDYKKAKSSNFASIADFIESNEIDFFTCDANEPDYDFLDEKKLIFNNNRDKGKNASLLFGSNRVHKMNDSLRDYYKQNNFGSNNSPIEVSYKTKTKDKRYDFIYYNSIKWKIQDLKYDYDNAIIAGSDHAMIIGDYKKI